jgi:[ribosomal protein S18]-alanine N-acetyltransferase
MALRPLTVADLGVLAALEQGAQPLPWSEDQLLLELVHDDARVVGAIVAGELVAYIALRKMLEELWVLNVATAPSARRIGHGRALLAEGERIARALGCTSLWLEVRESNAAARALYERMGFTARGKRALYYPPIPPATVRETAVLMARDL